MNLISGEPTMLKNMMYWLSFGVAPRREWRDDRRAFAGHTTEDERSFSRRMAFYKAHPHH